MADKKTWDEIKTSPGTWAENTPAKTQSTPWRAQYPGFNVAPALADPPDGDKGDIVVSDLGQTWMIDGDVLSSWGRTFIDDVDAATALATLGAAPIVHTHVTADVAGLDTALAGKASTAVVSSGASGLAPASGGGTMNFLRADATWTAPPASGIADAPNDGTQYGRQSLGWTAITPNPTWATLSGKPATFPPTLPILESDVTNLTTDLAGKASLTGATFTGGVIIDRTGAGVAATYQLKGDAGQIRLLQSMTGSLNRWQLRLGNATAEGGSNAGSDIDLFAFDDAGSSLGNVLNIARATRIVNFIISPTAPTPAASDNSTKVATTAYVDANKQPLDATLTAIAAAVTAADRLHYFSGVDTVSVLTFTAAGRALLDDADNTAQRTTLGLGTAATRNTGTSGTTVPLLDGANSWSARQTGSVLSDGAQTIPLAIVNAGSAVGTEAAIDLAPNANGVGIRSAQMVGVLESASVTGLSFRTANGSAPTERLRLSGPGGLYSTGVPGGDKGNGSINVFTIYQNNVPLASAAFVATGTSGATVPLLNAANTHADFTSPKIQMSGRHARTASSITLANGLNSNIVITTSYLKIVGPTAAFTLGGFIPTLTNGEEIWVYNGVSQAMTIANNNASSTAANRIATKTGADVVLAASQSYAHFIYDGGIGQWILMGSGTT